MLSKGIPQGLSFNPHWEGDAPAEPSLLGLASWAGACPANFKTGSSIKIDKTLIFANLAIGFSLSGRYLFLIAVGQA